MTVYLPNDSSEFLMGEIHLNTRHMSMAHDNSLLFHILPVIILARPSIVCTFETQVSFTCIFLHSSYCYEHSGFSKEKILEVLYGMSVFVIGYLKLMRSAKKCM